MLDVTFERKRLGNECNAPAFFPSLFLKIKSRKMSILVGTIEI
ncbi:MAG: hypothetical protein ACFFAS_10020 [Promethearchaeota archaeon]